jgi:aspartyl-tRNA(Asn)/glutamyl-tRNA(Gln) amidotransferase subunit B
VEASSVVARGGRVDGPAEPTSPGRDTGRAVRDEIRAGDASLQALFKRFQEELELSEDQADLLTGSKELAAFFEAAVASPANAPSLANWIMNELLRELKDRPLTDLPMKPGDLAALVNLLDGGTISQPVAKEIFVRMVEEGIDPRAEVAERGLEKLSDRNTLGALADEVLSENPRKAEEYRDGKTGLMGFFTGQVMRRTQGRADPRVVQELFRERLES